jgi:hypothetical protein
VILSFSRGAPIAVQAMDPDTMVIATRILFAIFFIAMMFPLLFKVNELFS